MGFFICKFTDFHKDKYTKNDRKPSVNNITMELENFISRFMDRKFLEMILFPAIEE